MRPAQGFDLVLAFSNHFGVLAVESIDLKSEAGNTQDKLRFRFNDAGEVDDCVEGGSGVYSSDVFP